MPTRSTTWYGRWWPLAGEDNGFPARIDDVLLGDQLAVVGADALAGTSGRGPPSAEKLFLLGEVVLHRFDLDGTLPKGEAVTALGGGDLVARLRGRGARPRAREGAN